MDCKICPLNIDSKSFSAKMISKIPIHFRNIFLCNNECSKTPCKSTLCSKDLWVLTFVGQKDKFAENHAVGTMENLVKKGFSELLCSLFENASHEVRRKMWKKMTSDYSNRLYMFDALFEKQCLAPIENADAENNEMQPYHNCVMFPHLAFEAA